MKQVCDDFNNILLGPSSHSPLPSSLQVERVGQREISAGYLRAVAVAVNQVPVLVLRGGGVPSDINNLSFQSFLAPHNGLETGGYN